MIGLNFLKFSASRALKGNVVYNGYIIPKTVIKNDSSYKLFFKQFVAKSKTNQKMDVIEVMKKASAIWKNMSENEKSKYNPAPELIESNKKLYEDYQNKFIQPIKNSRLSLYNYHALKIKEKGGLKNTPIKELGKLIKQSYDKLSQSQLTVLKKQLDQFKEKNKKSLQALEEYRIPSIDYQNEKQYYRYKNKTSNEDEKDKTSFGNLTKQQRQNITKQFKEKYADFKKKVEEFVDKTDIAKYNVKKILKGQRIDREEKENEKETTPQAKSAPKTVEKKEKKETKPRSKTPKKQTKSTKTTTKRSSSTKKSPAKQAKKE